MARLNPLFWLLKRTNYDDFADDFDMARKNPWSEFEEFSGLLSGKILDAGCGNGRLFGFLRGKNTEYFGIDASKKLIAAARKNFPDGDFAIGKIEKLDFQNHTFDAVAAIASFPHLPTERARKAALDEFFRVLRPGGNLVLTAWNLDQQRFETEKIAAKNRAEKYFWWDENELVIFFGEKKFPRLYRKFSENELKNFAKNAGFENIIVKNSGRNLVLTAQKPVRKKILGVPIDATTFWNALEKMKTEGGFWTTPNPEILVESLKNAKYAEILMSADFSVPDGIGLLWAADFAEKNRGKNFLFLRAVFSLLQFFFRKKSRFFPERVAGSDLFQGFCNATDERVFLLGGAPNAAKMCAKKFGSQFSWDDGSRQEWDDERIGEKINGSGATVLFVAFGAPWQEFWIARNRKNLPKIRLFVGVGGSFDFVAGTQKRAPKFFQKTGLEWLFRLIKEPKKRARRIWTAIWIFPKSIVKSMGKA